MIKISEEPERDPIPARDADAEGAAGPHIELLDLHSHPPVALAPRKRASSAALERLLAADLEFDPTSAPRSPSVPRGTPELPQVGAAAQAPHRGSEPHVVPDLELAPPPVSRKPSGARPIERAASEPTRILDLDDAPTGMAGSLDLDLPSDEPISIRPLSSSGARGVPAAVAPPSPVPPRTESESNVAVRESRPPISAAPTVSTTSGVDLGSSKLAGVRRPSVPSPAGRGRTLDLSSYEARPLTRRLRPALALLGAAVSIALLDPMYAAATGEILEVLGLRLSVFGGALLVLALGLGAREALRASDP